MKKFIYLFAVSIMLAGCFINSHTNKVLIEPFYLIAADSEDQMTISERIDDGSYVGVIEPTIFEFAIYADYILAKTKKVNSGEKSI